MKTVTQQFDEQLKVVVAFLLPTQKTLGLEANKSVNRRTQQTVPCRTRSSSTTMVLYSYTRSVLIKEAT